MADPTAKMRNGVGDEVKAVAPETRDLEAEFTDISNTMNLVLQDNEVAQAHDLVLGNFDEARFSALSNRSKVFTVTAMIALHGVDFFKARLPNYPLDERVANTLRSLKCGEIVVKNIEMFPAEQRTEILIGLTLSPTLRVDEVPEFNVLVLDALVFVPEGERVGVIRILQAQSGILYEVVKEISRFFPDEKSEARGELIRLIRGEIKKSEGELRFLFQLKGNFTTIERAFLRQAYEEAWGDAKK